MKKTLRNELLEISTKEQGIKLFVINDLLDYSDNNDDIKSYISDVLNYGCVSGVVTSLITYNDTENFTRNYLNEVLEILDNLIREIGEPAFTIDSNNLAWVGYEETLRQIVLELDLDI